MLSSILLSVVLSASSFSCDSPIVKATLLLLGLVVLMSGTISRHK
ncbi:MAG TPA: hypothetical protein VHX52_00145 [Steroidobacteraceae bacterium]|nr:hypothetical protein [Steroidobacteraceae bacterium]